MTARAKGQRTDPVIRGKGTYNLAVAVHADVYTQLQIAAGYTNRTVPAFLRHFLDTQVALVVSVAEIHAESEKEPTHD